MMYTYLFAHSSPQQKQLTSFLNKTDAIEHWAKCLPFAFLIVSGETATELARLVRAEFGTDLNFIILDTATDRNGWLGSGSWEMIRRPEDYSKDNRIHTLAKRLAQAMKNRQKK